MVPKKIGVTKRAVLQLLYAHRSGYLSGQRISEELGCSRTAVWKHVRELENDGYHIEAVQKSGYRLQSAPEGVSDAAILALLTTKRLGRQIVFYDRLDSTQKLALQLADEGAEEGTLVVTNEQTAGRGRLGHAWQSARGANIAMSFILRPELAIDRTPQLTLLTAVAAADAIERVSGLCCAIKWPNDILYEGAKLVGILTELQAEATYVKAIVIGIGMNVNTDAEAFKGALCHKATSLRTVTGQSYEPAVLICQFLERFETLYHAYLTDGFAVIKPLWMSRALSLGKYISVRKPGGQILRGKAVGIDDDGVLLLEASDGSLTHVYSADIEWS
ncbi:MAG: biotin--[acetyl-CoA-carboxylase] ligase [Sporolactobacillus sp.]